MSCMCKKTMSALFVALPQIGISAQASASASMNIALSADLQALARLLAAMGLPAPPWTPNPAWLTLPLPRLALNASAMATISAFAQLRADVLAQFGIDLLVPGQAAGFARLAATLQARLAAMLAVNANLGLTSTAWMQLAATLSATLQVQEALNLGLLPAPPAPVPQMSLWREFLALLASLLPIIAVSSQLGLNMNANISAQLAMAVRAMLQIRLPVFPPASLALMASITASLSAIAQLRASLGIDPLALGLPAVHLMVSERVALTARAVQTATGMPLPSLLSLLNLLPRPDFSPANMATPATVAAAMNINATALAAVNWQVPAIASLPVLSVGLPVTAFAAQLNAAMGLSASAALCATCDSAALMASASAHA